MPERQRSARRRWLAPVMLAAGLLLAGVAWFLVFGAWWLNSDGSAYLTLGHNVLHGNGYRLADGTPLDWWDRPVYPLALVAPWVVHESLEASIWASRVPFVVMAPVTGLLTLRLTRSYVAAAVAGVAAVAQPLSLAAGGSFFVPDGWVTATLVLTVVAATLAALGARIPWGWSLAAVLATVLAFLTKETGAIGAPLAVLVFVLLRTRPPRGVVLALVVAVAPATYVATALAAGSTGTSVLHAVATAPQRMHHQAFGDSSLSVVVGLLVIALLAWSVPRVADPLVLVGLVLVSCGIGFVAYASGAGLAVRNGALLPAGAAFLLGALVHDSLSNHRKAWSRLGTATAAALVLSLVGASAAVALSRQPADQQGWQIEGSDNVARWLTTHATGSKVGCTLQYCSYYWLATGGRLDVDLIPHYAARVRPAETPEDLRWDERVGFRGRGRATPPCSGPPLVVTRSDERYGSVRECALLDYVRSRRPSYLVVTGWGALTFDAGALIPYLEVSPAFRRVFLEKPPTGKWWQVMAVYEVLDDDPQPVADAPTYYSSLAWAGLRGARSERDRLMDPLCFARTMDAVLEADTDLDSWSAFPSCESPS